MRYCEEWIEAKLTERLYAYKQQFPAFKIDRVLHEVEKWDEKAQRWSPYMKDLDIKRINKRFHKMRSLNSLVMNEHL